MGHTNINEGRRLMVSTLHVKFVLHLVLQFNEPFGVCLIRDLLIRFVFCNHLYLLRQCTLVVHIFPAF